MLLTLDEEAEVCSSRHLALHIHNKALRESGNYANVLHDQYTTRLVFDKGAQRTSFTILLGTFVTNGRESCHYANVLQGQYTSRLAYKVPKCYVTPAFFKMPKCYVTPAFLDASLLRDTCFFFKISKIYVTSAFHGAQMLLNTGYSKCPNVT